MTEYNQGGLDYSHLSNKRGCWNKRGGEAKIAKSINVEGGFFCGCWNFSKSVSVDSTFIREMRVDFDNILDYYIQVQTLSIQERIETEK